MRIMLTVGIVLMAATAGGCRLGSGEPTAGTGEAQHEAPPPEPAKGPHGGRLLRQDQFAVEITIFERGVPPEFRVYAYDRETPLDPAEVKVTVTLRRVGGRVDLIAFAKRDDYLLGDAAVEEPHSFDVEVTAEHGGRSSRWTYPSYEGRTEMSPAAIASSHIGVETAGPATIRTVVHPNGRISPIQDRVARVVPRYPGVVKEVRARLGDVVQTGQTLAVVENNTTLQAYDVKAPIGGTIIDRGIIAGEQARDGASLFTVADLGTVWADLDLPQHEASRVRVGQTTTISSGQDDTTIEGRITYMAPIGTARTQTRLARVEVANASGAWAPGLYITAEIVVEETTVPVAVRTNALQTFRDWDVVFLNEGSVFQAMPLELGRRDANWVEVVSGVTANQRYVTDNSFIVKADVGKSGASHDH